MTRVLLLGALVLLEVLWPTSGEAQQAGYYATPSVGLSGVVDDNIFLTSAHREADFIVRLTPGMTAGYRSAPFTILGSYAFDVETYAVHRDLDNVGNRQLGTLEFKYLPEHRLTLALTGVYAKTNRPVELSGQTGLQPIARVERGLEESTAITVSPSVTYQLAKLWSATGGYSYSLLQPEHGSSTTLHAVNLGLTRQLTVVDTGSLTYIARRFEEERGATATSHVMLVGWIRRLSPFTTATLQAGPRLADGKIDAEALAVLRHRLKFADLSVSYSRTEALTPAESGTVVTDTFTAQAAFVPLRFLQVSVQSAAQRSTSEAGSGSSNAPIYYYSIGGTATYQINRWLSARAAYTGSLQDSGRQQILSNVFSLSLIATYPMRLY